jgi:hypothetical protein
VGAERRRVGGVEAPVHQPAEGLAGHSGAERISDAGPKSEGREDAVTMVPTRLGDLRVEVCGARPTAMLPASVAVRFLRDPIRYRPVAELVPARLFIAWPRETESAEVAGFVRVAKKVAGTEAQVWNKAEMRIVRRLCQPSGLL